MIGKVGSCHLFSHSLDLGYTILQLSAFPLPHSNIGREGASAGAYLKLYEQAVSNPIYGFLIY